MLLMDAWQAAHLSCCTLYACMPTLQKVIRCVFLTLLNEFCASAIVCGMVEWHSLRRGCVARFGMSLYSKGQVNQRQVIKGYDVMAKQCPTLLLLCLAVSCAGDCQPRHGTVQHLAMIAV